jgi:hypothetical protein
MAFLAEEKRALLAAPLRIAEIDEELAVLQAEKVRIDARRPPREIAGPAVVEQPPSRVR